MDIFCSTSQRSNALQKSSNEILPWPHWSASIIVRSAILINWSWLMFAPTIMCSMFNSSSREIDSSSSKSYIRNATEIQSKFSLNSPMHCVWLRLFTFQFLLTRVQIVRAVLVDGSEMCQHLHEFTEIHTIIGGVRKKRMHNSVAQWIDGQLGNS